METGRRYERELPVGPGLAWVVLGEMVEAQGGELQRRGATAELFLPVRAGLRRGLLRGRVDVAEAPAGSRVVLEVHEVDLVVHTQATVLLAASAVAGLAAILWPFFPVLLPLAPLAIVVSLGTWFLIVSRLDTAGPEELLEAAAAEAGVTRDER